MVRFACLTRLILRNADYDDFKREKRPRESGNLRGAL